MEIKLNADFHVALLNQSANSLLMQSIWVRINSLKYNFRRQESITGIPGLWTQELDAELWTLDSRRWTLDTGLWTFLWLHKQPYKNT